MNTILLRPTDVLFFRDGRPMSGSLSGHGAAWPLPSVTNAALHAALHRAEIAGVHAHRRGRSGQYEETRDRKFGSLTTAGPFPVTSRNQWFFPRPLDAGVARSAAVTFAPLADFDGSASSLPPPLKYPVANMEAASKDVPENWLSSTAFEAYLSTSAVSNGEAREHFATDASFSDSEFTYGIGIDPASGTQDGEQFYSASYLRLRDGCQLGMLAEAWDKDLKEDLVAKLLDGDGEKILVGGQQRVCTAKNGAPKHLPLPTGQRGNFNSPGKFLVKWVLLTPAIYPGIPAGISKRGTRREAHPGGWLPTWVCPKTGRVLLETVSEEERKRRRNLNASGKGYPSHPNIDAHLVAADTGKAIPVTGYALPNRADPDRARGGSKSTHPAVPAGAVYYFECGDQQAAINLASALNWHGAGDASTIRNRRSTLMGEKGFGLGVCGTWSFHDGNIPGNPHA